MRKRGAQRYEEEAAEPDRPERGERTAQNTRYARSEEEERNELLVRDSRAGERLGLRTLELAQRKPDGEERDPPFPDEGDGAGGAGLGECLGDVGGLHACRQESQFELLAFGVMPRVEIDPDRSLEARLQRPLECGKLLGQTVELPRVRRGPVERVQRG